jgi:hypothetical protein
VSVGNSQKAARFAVLQYMTAHLEISVPLSFPAFDPELAKLTKARIGYIFDCPEIGRNWLGISQAGARRIWPVAALSRQ